MKNTFLFYCPFTGLGNYGGFRGNRWLRNRITVFKQFVIPSLLNQTDRDFVHWIQWRPEERGNRYVLELERYLKEIPNYRFVFTYEGLCFWDDKLTDEEARVKMATNLRRTLPALFDYTPDSEEIIMMLSPSDDLYDKMTVESVRLAFKDKNIQAVSYTKGWITNYFTKELLEYNPKTNPPFFAMKFPRETFFDVGKHMNYLSLKQDVGKYKKGTPYPSHEYIGECLNTAYLEGRGFLVGTHQENISTHFNHPYGGQRVDGWDRDVLLDRFGILTAPNLELPVSIRKMILRRLPYRVQRKLRYIFGELLFNRLYNYLRN